jgi:hypothetical protein
MAANTWAFMAKEEDESKQGPGGRRRLQWTGSVEKATESNHGAWESTVTVNLGAEGIDLDDPDQLEDRQKARVRAVILSTVSRDLLNAFKLTMLQVRGLEQSSEVSGADIDPAAFLKWYSKINAEFQENNTAPTNLRMLELVRWMKGKDASYLHMRKFLADFTDIMLAYGRSGARYSDAQLKEHLEDALDGKWEPQLAPEIKKKPLDFMELRRVLNAETAKRTRRAPSTTTAAFEARQDTRQRR